MRLAGEHVVTPHRGRPATCPSPLTIELADQLFGARCVIELGVADVAVGRIADDDLAVLDDYAQRLAAVVAADDATLDEFLDTSHSYHMHFVGLGGSPQLRETYSALGISVLWRRAMDGRTGARGSTSSTTPRSPGPAATATSRGPVTSSPSTPSRCAGSSAR